MNQLAADEYRRHLNISKSTHQVVRMHKFSPLIAKLTFPISGNIRGETLSTTIRSVNVNRLPYTVYLNASQLVSSISDRAR